MTSESEIEGDVREELQWAPDLNAEDIAVSVKHGVVMLAGFTRSYTDRLEAEAAAKRVAGVHAVANDIEVRQPAIDPRPDPDIARDAVAALTSQLPISHEKIKVIVKDGWITLEGAADVRFWLEREEAERVAWSAPGVTHVEDRIAVSP